MTRGLRRWSRLAGVAIVAAALVLAAHPTARGAARAFGVGGGAAGSATSASPGAARTVAELLARPPDTGRVKVVGHVARLFFCPACPPGAACKPCLGDHLVLSDEAHALEPGDELGPADVLVFGERTALKRLRAGARYEVDADVRATRSARQAINDLGLLSAKARP